MLPASLTLLLTTVAIVDDMGAVAVTALAYTPGINGTTLLGAAVVAGIMFTLNRAGVIRLAPYLGLPMVRGLDVGHPCDDRRRHSREPDPDPAVARRA